MISFTGLKGGFKQVGCFGGGATQVVVLSGRASMLESSGEGVSHGVPPFDAFVH